MTLPAQNHSTTHLTGGGELVSHPASTKETTTGAGSVRDGFYYRRVYDARREATQDREWTAGHSHNDALRIVGKEILRDLWAAAQPPTHQKYETHPIRGGGNLPDPPPTALSTPTSETVGGQVSQQPDPFPAPMAASAAGFLDLRIWAETYYDAQKTRIAITNRLERGGIEPDLLAGHKQNLDLAENAFRLAMRGAYRRLVKDQLPGVWEWQQTYRGIGEHLMARLLGHLGHPAIAEPHAWMSEPPEGHSCDSRCGVRHLVAFQPYWRTVSQLWSYCGHGDPNRRRRRGMSQEDAFGLGNPTLKMLVHLLAKSAMKQKPPPARRPFDTRTDYGGGNLPDTPTPRLCDTQTSSVGGVG